MYEIQIREVEPQATAVVRSRAKQPELAEVVPRGCGEVWDFMRSSGLPRPGRNLALYLDDVMNIEVGVEVLQPFEGSDRVVCSSLPGGRVATTTHWGAYDRLVEAHVAIRQYCAEHGHALAGPSWEIYGHWTDNTDDLQTDIFYLLS